MKRKPTAAEPAVPPPPAGPVPFERPLALGLLHDMLRVRRMEEKCAELYGEGKIRGFLHLYIGEEAVAAGALRALRPVPCPCPSCDQWAGPDQTVAARRGVIALIRISPRNERSGRDTLQIFRFIVTGQQEGERAARWREAGRLALGDQRRTADRQSHGGLVDGRAGGRRRGGGWAADGQWVPWQRDRLADRTTARLDDRPTGRPTR